MGPAITRIVCSCGTVLADPFGATATEVAEGGCRECQAEHRAERDADDAAWAEAMRERWDAEAACLDGPE